MAENLGSSSPRATGTSNERVKRPIAEANSRELPQAAASAELKEWLPTALESSERPRESSPRMFVDRHGDGDDNCHQKQKQKHQQQQMVGQQQDSSAVRHMIETQSTAQALPQPPSPATAKPTSSVGPTHFRKRVRCDAHKHYDPEVGFKAGGHEVVRAGGREVAAEVCRESGGGGGGQEIAGDDVSEPKAHVHGASCGHVAVLHDGHVDFLMGSGQLECYDRREVRYVFGRPVSPHKQRFLTFLIGYVALRA